MVKRKGTETIQTLFLPAESDDKAVKKNLQELNHTETFKISFWEKPTCSFSLDTNQAA